MRSVRGRQFDLNLSAKNAWIVKPAGKSRGRGIACFDSLDDILEYSRATSKESQWIVQKYLENSLIVHKRKFDIRQWVLVTSWEPLIAWFYDDCYLRFCVNEYTLDDLEDKFKHLANNSISKKSPKFDATPIEGSMWRRNQFVEYLNSQGKDGERLWNERVVTQMKQAAQASLKCVQSMVENRAHSFEIYGFDFMLDNELNPWLIEVNSSPSMEYSTTITKDLTKKALTDLVACVLDVKYTPSQTAPKKLNTQAKVKNIGGWELLSTGTPCGRRQPEMFSTNGLSVEGRHVPLPKKKRRAFRKLSRVAPQIRTPTQPQQQLRASTVPPAIDIDAEL